MVLPGGWKYEWAFGEYTWPLRVGMKTAGRQTSETEEDNNEVSQPLNTVYRGKSAMAAYLIRCACTDENIEVVYLLMQSLLFFSRQ